MRSIQIEPASTEKAATLLAELMAQEMAQVMNVTRVELACALEMSAWHRREGKVN